MLETRALRALLRYRDTSQTPYRRITPAMRADLLQWAATLSDEELLDMRNVGHVLLGWIREHQTLSAGPVEALVLEVDWLAEAIEFHSHADAASEVIIACGRGHVERCAPSIAAEYERLSRVRP